MTKTKNDDNNNNTHINGHSDRIPFYSIEGTHYECSFKLGQLTTENIRDRIEKGSEDFQPLFDFIKTTNGSKYLTSYSSTIEKKFPWYYDELKGISDGSQIPLEQILVINYKNELKAAKDLNDKKEKDDRGRTSCSTVCINRLDNDEKLLFIAHNEDELDCNWNNTFIIQATIHSSIYSNDNKDERRESPNERYIALGYAGQLVGNGFAVNHHGFAFTYNGLYAKTPLIENCLPRQVHNRLVLTIENEQELYQLLETEITAYGFNLSVGRFRYPDSLSPEYLLSFEIGPSSDNKRTNQCNVNYTLNEKQINDSQITPKHNKDTSSSSISSNYYCHFNHYIHLQTVPEEERPLPSSHMRTKRAEEVGEMKTINEVLQLLGDEKDKSVHPIYRRSSTGQTNTVTLCTALIDLHKAMLYVYDDNPALTTSGPFFQFDLNNL